jgi:Uma2 family endonuclease
MAVVGESGSGKSLLTKYLIHSYFQDAHVRVYDSDAAPGEWGALDVTGRSGDYVAIAEGMAEDIEELRYRTALHGEGEAFGGEVVRVIEEYPSTAAELALDYYALHTGRGRAFPDGIGFRVHLPHRESFSPDAAYHFGPRMGMWFAEGAPIFAVEVRSENDYDPAAERAMQEKRADYFACGTLVVWDVELLSENVIRSYKASDSDNPVIFRRGDMADAEPAVPGWRMPLDDVFR